MPSNSEPPLLGLPSVAQNQALSPVAATYLQQLIHQNLDRFIWSAPPIATPPTSSRGDIPLGSAATPAIARCLAFPRETEVTEAIAVSGLQALAIAPPLVPHADQLEHLLVSHQRLITQAGSARQALRQIEDEIFGLLGLSVKPDDRQAQILLVDDSQEVLRLLQTMLTHRGYQVQGVTQADQALLQARELQPDLILLDILMPQMDGYTVCAQLKQDPQTCQIPVVFISAIDQPLDKVKAFQLGAMDYIAKPFQIEEVWVRVEHQLALAELRQRLEGQNVRLQQELQRQAETSSIYQQLFNRCVDGMYRTSLEGCFLQVNLALAKMLGYESGRELMQSVQSVAQQLYVLPSRRSEFLQYLQQHGAIAQFESQVYRQDGTQLWVSESARAIMDDQGNWVGFEGTVRDISERKATELQFWHERLQVEQSLTKLILAHLLGADTASILPE